MTPQQIISDLCAKYGPRLSVQVPLDGARVLWALAGCESDFGVNGLPRHEQGYCYGHAYDVKPLSRQWGCAAHCSYGPWQMMFAHLHDLLPAPLRDPSLLIFPAGENGQKFRIAADYLCVAAVDFLNAEILGSQGATTLAQIAKAWNHGNWRDSYDDSGYTTRAARFYDVPLEAAPDGARDSITSSPATGTGLGLGAAIAAPGGGAK